MKQTMIDGSIHNFIETDFEDKDGRFEIEIQHIGWRSISGTWDLKEISEIIKRELSVTVIRQALTFVITKRRDK